MNPFADIGRQIVDRPGAPVKPEDARKRNMPPRLALPSFVNPWGLSAMQCEVLRRVVLGETAKEIGVALGRSHKTVEVHFERLKEKMGARSMLVAALMWDRHFHEE